MLGRSIGSSVVPTRSGLDPGRRQPGHRRIKDVACGGDETHRNLALGGGLVVGNGIVEDDAIGRPGRRTVELVADDRIEITAARRRQPQDLAHDAASVEPHLERLRQQLARQPELLKLVEAARVRAAPSAPLH